MTIIEQIIALLTRYGSGRLFDYKIELCEDIRITCDPEKGLAWYNEQAINEWDENCQRNALKWVTTQINHTAMTTYLEEIQEAREKYENIRNTILQITDSTDNPTSREPHPTTEPNTAPQETSKEEISITNPRCELRTRTINALHAAGITTTGQLCTKTEKELLLTRQIGTKALNEIKTYLKKRNLSLNEK